MTNDGNVVQETDDLFNQLKNKVQFDIAKDANIPIELNQTETVDQNKQTNDALNDYINDLKKN